MTLASFKKRCAKMLTEYPENTAEINDIYQLVQEDIRDGDSEEHAVELALSDLNDLIQVHVKGY